MTRKNRIPEENARREKIRELNIPARGNRESGEMETTIPVEREPLFR